MREELAYVKDGWVAPGRTLREEAWKRTGKWAELSEEEMWPAVREAAEMGNSGAQYKLGKGLLFGEIPGVPPDRAEAVRWLRRADAQGDLDASELLLSIGEKKRPIKKDPPRCPFTDSELNMMFIKGQISDQEYQRYKRMSR